MLVTIACLGWGSLVWNPENLPVLGAWKEDGPSLPFEFARHSSRDRITLVVTSDGLSSLTLWAALDVSDLAAGVRVLAERESTNAGNIGYWPPYPGQVLSAADAAIGVWAKEKGLAGVVWTALPPKWLGVSGRAPTLSEALEHLSGLTGEKLAGAVEYIRRAPPQIETRFRPKLMAEADRLCPAT